MSANPVLTDILVRVVQAVFALAEREQLITALAVATTAGLGKTAVRRPLAKLEAAGYLVSQLDDHTTLYGRVPMQLRARVYTLTERGHALALAAGRSPKDPAPD